jgi:hypothetical protein
MYYTLEKKNCVYQCNIANPSLSEHIKDILKSKYLF